MTVQFTLRHTISWAEEQAYRASMAIVDGAVPTADDIKDAKLTIAFCQQIIDGVAMISEQEQAADAHRRAFE